MDLSSIPILATAISIIICWSLFAIFCSFIQEGIAQIKEERGRFMKKNIFRQLYDKPNGLNWGSLVYMHGTIDLLSKSSDRPTSDIAPKLFAETLIEVVGKSHVVQMQRAKLTAQQLPFQNELLKNFKAATLVLQPSDVVNFFEQAFNSATLQATVNGQTDEAAIYKSLVSQIEIWYGEVMQRLSIWYKKKTRLTLFLIGSILALTINVDSIQLFSHFNKNDLSRKTVMNYYQADAERLNDLVKNTTDTTSLDSLQKRIKSYHEEMSTLLKEASLPVGWDHSYLNLGKAERENFFLKLLGIIISGFAASFGAPFWFELLKKIYTRNTTKK